MTAQPVICGLRFSFFSYTNAVAYSVDRALSCDLVNTGVRIVDLDVK